MLEKNKNKLGQTLLYIPLFFGIGIGLFFLFNIDVSLYIIGGAFAGISLLLYLFRQRKVYHALLMILFVIVGYGNITYHAKMAEKPLERRYDNLWIEGEIEKIELLASAQRITLNNVIVDGKGFDDFPKKVRIKVNGLNYNFLIGDRVKMRATFIPPAIPSYPNGYDFSIKAWFEGISAVGFNTSKIMIYAPNNEEISVVDRIVMFTENIRNTISNKIREILPKDTSRVALALVIGEQSAIDNKILQDYRDTGLAHILSVSGMHMSVLAFLVFGIFRTGFALFPTFATYYDIKKISAFLALSVAFFYLMISGMAIPAQRSFIMVFVVFFAILIGRKAISLRSVAVAGIMILAISPQSLLNAGFQMSFAAVAALIAFYEYFYVKRGKTITSIGLIYIYGIILTSLIGTIATAPYVIYHFNRFPVYSVVANLFVSTLFSILIMPFLLISMVLMPFGIEKIPLEIAGIGIGWMNDIAEVVANFPGAVSLLPQIDIWILISISIGGYLFILSNFRYKILYLTPVVALFVSFLTYQKPDFIINEDSSLIGVNNTGNIMLSPGRGNRMERNVWLSVNAQLNNADTRKEGRDFYETICDDENNCTYIKDEFKFIFKYDKNIKDKELKIYKNNKLYQTINKNDLRDNKTMLFYVGKNDLRIDTVKENKIRWWK